MPEHHRVATLRKYVTFLSATNGRDGAGGVTKTWSTFAQDWGDMNYLQGRELESAQKINSQIQASLLMRFRSDLTVQMKFTLDNITWNIHSIIPDDRQFYMTIFASQVK